jgi:hypothetical protein
MYFDDIVSPSHAFFRASDRRGGGQGAGALLPSNFREVQHKRTSAQQRGVPWEEISSKPAARFSVAVHGVEWYLWLCEGEERALIIMPVKNSNRISETVSSGRGWGEGAGIIRT